MLVRIANREDPDQTASSEAVLSGSALFVYKQVSMIRKYHYHVLHTNPRHHEEEPHNTNSHKTSRNQLKQSNQLSLPCQDDCKTREDTKECISKQRPNKELSPTLALFGRQPVLKYLSILTVKQDRAVAQIISKTKHILFGIKMILSYIINDKKNQSF